MNDVLLRALAAVAFLLLVAIATLAARRVAATQRERVLGAPADAALATGSPTILYFHGDRCGDCVVQERELDALLIAHPEVAIRADHAPSELSSRYRVLTVPTTVLLDGAGAARAVHYGLVRREVLERELAEFGALEASA